MSWLIDTCVLPALHHDGLITRTPDDFRSHYPMLNIRVPT